MFNKSWKQTTRNVKIEIKFIVQASIVPWIHFLTWFWCIFLCRLPIRVVIFSLAIIVSLWSRSFYLQSTSVKESRDETTWNKSHFVATKLALKRLQYVINACLSPVSKFIGHYKMQFYTQGESWALSTEWTYMCIFYFFYFFSSVGSSIRKMTTKVNMRKRIEQNKKSNMEDKIVVIALLKTQIYSNPTILCLKYIVTDISYACWFVHLFLFKSWSKGKKRVEAARENECLRA